MSPLCPQTLSPAISSWARPKPCPRGLKTALTHRVISRGDHETVVVPSRSAPSRETPAMPQLRSPQQAERLIERKRPVGLSGLFGAHVSRAATDVAGQ